MKTEETIKIYCYSQHCSSRTGGIVPAREIEAWEGENPEMAEAGYFCDDWDLVAEGTRDEIRAELASRISVMKLGRVRDSNDMFALRQLRIALSVVD